MVRFMDIKEQIENLKKAQQRRKEVLRMRQAGKSLKEISIALGVTRERARQLVAAAIRDQS